MCQSCANTPKKSFNVAKGDSIQGAGSMADVEGEKKFAKRLETRNKLLAQAKKAGKKNIKPSYLRQFGG